VVIPKKMQRAMHDVPQRLLIEWDTATT